MIDKEKVIQDIKERLKPIDPEKVILFGSFAYGTPHKESDIDLLVVTKDDFIPRNFSEKQQVHLKVANALQDFMREYPTDLITHTKKMHENFIATNSSFARELREKGIVLNE